MFLALVPPMTDRTIRNDTIMTGEISLRGLVLPVGASSKRSSPRTRRASNASCCRRASALEPAQSGEKSQPSAPRMADAMA
jgi:predicted ATP-dependent serine protease